MTVTLAAHSDSILPGHIYIAPADHHLTLEYGKVSVLCGPKENGHRPAVDPLFRTAARVYGSRVIGVVLSGGLDCGSAGLLAIKARGGISVVQHPNDAVCPDMPTNALRNLTVEHVVATTEIAPLLHKKILPLFHYSLNSGGVLMPGPSESIGGSELFSVIDKR